MAAAETTTTEEPRCFSSDVATDFSALTEDCIAHALSLATPRDVCRSAAVSSAFHSAASSDVVWRRFLPPDNDDILLLSSGKTKRETFFGLCEVPVLIDDGNLSLALERESGRKCVMLSARKLFIAWSAPDTPYHWHWTRIPGTQFAEVAVLAAVSWLEIRGKVDAKLLSRRTAYAAFLVYKLAADWYGLIHPPQAASVKVLTSTSTKVSGHAVRLQTMRGAAAVAEGVTLPFPRARRRSCWRSAGALRRSEEAAEMESGVPRARDDGWSEVLLGEFFVGDGEEEVEMSLTEVRGRHSKGGLIVLGIELRPMQPATAP